MTTFTFQYEPVAHLLSCGLHDMCYRHWLETGQDFPYDPDFEAYERLEKSNDFRILAVRFHGHLIGYAGIRIYKNLQSRNVSSCYIQEYFIEPKFRSKGAGLQLFRVIGAHLKLMKIGYVTVHVPENIEKVGKIFKHLKYNSKGVLWGKSLA